MEQLVLLALRFWIVLALFCAVRSYKANCFDGTTPRRTAPNDLRARQTVAVQNPYVQRQHS
jgi:hypothetical protein